MRTKFLLQDVQELRSNQWVPRPRQLKQLKTIDQVRGYPSSSSELAEKGWGPFRANTGVLAKLN